MAFVCMMISEKELSSEALEFIPVSVEEKLFKIFLENDLKRTYENHFFNHLDMTSVLHEIFEQDLMKSLSIPEVVPCTLKSLNISEDTNDGKSSTCARNHTFTHRDFLDSESESSSVKTETSSVELEVAPCTLEECKLSSGILNRMVTPKRRSVGIPICSNFLEMCLQAKTSLELEKLIKGKVLSSQNPKALKLTKSFQEKFTWQQKEKWLKNNKSLTSVVVISKEENQSGRKKQRVPIWYLDSGCSRHMTGDRGLLTLYQEKSGGGSVTFGDNKKGQIKGYGVIAKKDIDVCRVAYVDGLKHNLLSVSQLCDNGFYVMFKQQYCSLLSSRTGTELIDNGTKFKNSTIEAYLTEEGISHNFSAARTPQQNGVVERKNWTLVEAARTMLIAYGLSTSFWQKPYL
ncbi:hypothetical protein L6452_32783 [Arctium lappa]|uniref:Uncharacterized protein n=1 Tax=Arctium lappa TaxID=4217 RepID=A0ACB8Z6G1_ARCLA|nr:hypothetical protein L6452_32783 [Arctium lappa]